MLSFLTKKKVQEKKLAEIFVNSTLKTIDEGFPEVVSLIQEDPEFKTPPTVDLSNSDDFLFIILAGNLEFIPNYFTDYQDFRLINQIMAKLSDILAIEVVELQKLISSYQQYLHKVNHPSKNTHYAMSKAIFYKYELNNFQQEYFMKMKTPNPIFLKRLDEIVSLFIWDWDSIKAKLKVVE
jgi:hypothetical protein|tara:strand:+ start:3408 stop:3950 length:543 start_codon:yes stop_codon:yes gene_type:complete